MNVKTTWNGKVSFTGAVESGLTIPLDNETDSTGESVGFSPMELIALGLAGCTAMDVISILTKKRQRITDFEVQVHTRRAAEHPKVFTQAVIEYFVTGQNVEEAAVLRAIELSAFKYCPAQAMLGQVMPIKLLYHVYEDAGDGKRNHLVDGECHLATEANG